MPTSPPPSPLPGVVTATTSKEDHTPPLNDDNGNHDDDDDSSKSGETDDDDKDDVSLSKIKNKIRGGRPPATAEISMNDAEVLLCPICRNIYDTPISLPCGHNYCHSCWEHHYKEHCSCPLCRAPVPSQTDWCVNRVLQHCLLRLSQELQSKRRGEPESNRTTALASSADTDNCPHTAVIVSTVHQDDGQRLGRTSLWARRSFVEAESQTMRYCLALVQDKDNRPESAKFCVLHLEEDECNDELPVWIYSGDDDAECLVVNHDTNLTQSIVTIKEVETKQTLLQKSMHLVEWGFVQSLRTRSGTTLRVVHEETQACLQIESCKSSSHSERADSCEGECEMEQEESEQEEEDDDDDGFLVEEEGCYICKDGGELLMCDGDCYRSYHIGCIGRDELPQSENWLCQECAAKKGIVVAESGYEFDDEDSNDENEPRENDHELGEGFSSDDEAVPDRPREASYGDLHNTDDDDDDEGAQLQSRPRKRQRTIDDDSDDE